MGVWSLGVFLAHKRCEWPAATWTRGPVLTPPQTSSQLLLRDDAGRVSALQRAPPRRNVSVSEERGREPGWDIRGDMFDDGRGACRQDTRFDLSLDPRGLFRTGLSVWPDTRGHGHRVSVHRTAPARRGATVQRGGAAPMPERAGATSKSPRAGAEFFCQRAPPGESSHEIATIA